MTLLARSTMSGGMAVSKWPGLGIPGAEVPTSGGTGDKGSPLATDNLSPTAEYRIATVSLPSSGTLTIYPDTSFDYAPAADGNYTWSFNLYENNALVSGGPEVVTLNVGVALQVLAITGRAAGSSWLASNGGTPQSCVDEASPDSADYAYTNTPGAWEEWIYENGGAVSAAGGKFSYRVEPGNGSVLVELRQGATVLETWGPHAMTGAIQNFTQTITASTSDSNDLRIRFTAG